ncbi:hypothetical protein ACWCQK_32600 [Streptomyces sp. NPDC002306]
MLNNAGRGLLGALEESTDAETRSRFDLDIGGLMNVIAAISLHLTPSAAAGGPLT